MCLDRDEGPKFRGTEIMDASDSIRHEQVYLEGKAWLSRLSGLFFLFKSICSFGCQGAKAETREISPLLEEKTP
jgi:hypothetical protein